MNNHHPHHVPAARSTQRPPTRRQLGYLRALAAQRGETFATPGSFDEADAEIKRMKPRTLMHRTDRFREDRAVVREMAERGGAAAVDHDYETSGWGSSARWV